MTSRLFLSLCLVAAACRTVGAAGLEGLYGYGPEREATVRLRKGKEEGSFVGVVTASRGRWHKRLVHQTVLELRQTNERELRGRGSAAFFRLADDLAAWVDLPRVEVLDGGDLRCTLQVGPAGTAEVLLRRLAEPAPAAPAPVPAEGDAGELAGTWQDPQGAVIVFVSYRDSYVGQVARLSPELRRAGLQQGEEIARAQRKAAGHYEGTWKVKGRGGEKTRWEPVGIAVAGHRLECVRQRPGGGQARFSAVRLSSESGEPLAEPAGRDPGELAGLWREPFGGVIRYARVRENRYVGRIERLSARNRGFGFAVGEEGVRLQRTGTHTYRGTVKVKTEGGRESWWEPIEITVRGDVLRYTRHRRSGARERGSAVRVP